ncbi:DNA sulfur modification protein DndB [Teredinibacter turnerae]|uniref:DNA sulfur modification protein DndB n=1 Tax=Teredinibacter turnerae TaxID=2426 RepID=UPI000491BF22|nr:DNA sulfur modification protein DndB [Teredinibacter turnerae]
MSTSFEYVFPAIRGIQAGREYYVSMCPMRLIPKIFIFDEEELVPELRSQRELNRPRIPAITEYLVDNAKDYVFSSITASIDGKVNFKPLGAEGEESRVGTLKIDMNSQFIINDGQHRRAAIEEAIKTRPEIGDETISVVFFIDKGLERCQQMFADLNRYAIKTSPSLGILYDHRDEKARMSKLVVSQSQAFRDIVEMEKSSLSPRSRKLFTLSAIHSANLIIISGHEFISAEESADICTEYWDDLLKYIPEWSDVKEGKLTSGEVRQNYVHSHSILLHAFGTLGRELLSLSKIERKKRLKSLSGINWKRSNARTWEGRSMQAGRMQKSSSNALLTSNYLKNKVGLQLTPEELRAEEAYKRGKNG